MFHAASTITDAVVREWNALSSAAMVELRTWLLQYLVENQTVAKATREKLTRAAAIIFKRAATEQEDTRAVLTAHLGQLFAGPPQQHFVALSMIGAMVTEFGHSSHECTGMSWETHIATKKRFEDTILRELFVLVVQNVQRYAGAAGGADARITLVLLDQGLGVCEQVLSWSFAEFQSEREAGTAAADSGGGGAASFAAATFRGGPAWQAVLCESVPTFVQLYQAMRLHESQAHKCQQCLIQLASTGRVFTDAAAKQRFLKTFIQSVVSLLDAVLAAWSASTPAGHGPGAELLGFSWVLGRLVGSFQMPALLELGKPAVEAIFNKLMELTKKSLQLMSLGGDGDDGGADGEGATSEAVDKAFEVWHSMLVRVAGRQKNRRTHTHTCVAPCLERVHGRWRAGCTSIVRPVYVPAAGLE